MKEWFKARNIWGAAINALSDDEAGKLAKAIWAYTMRGEITQLDGTTSGIFAMILMTLGQDEEREAEISEKRALVGSLGGKQKQANAIKAMQMLANGSNCQQDIANVANATNKNQNQNKSKESDRESKRFTPPSLEEVREYCRERKNGINAEHFIDYYATRGWELKPGQKVKDWKACIRTWEQREKTPDIRPLKKPLAQDYTQRDYSEPDADPDEVLAMLAGRVAR